MPGSNLDWVTGQLKLDQGIWIEYSHCRFLQHSSAFRFTLEAFRKFGVSGISSSLNNSSALCVRSDVHFNNTVSNTTNYR